MIPDRRRFGILWMGRQRARRRLRHGGRLQRRRRSGWRRGASADAVIAEVDRLLEPYGGLGAIPRRLQMSAWTLENELAQLRTFGVLTPLIFLGVAAFILNVALSRALALQRAQIAALKALGYSNRDARLALHEVGGRHRAGRRRDRRRGGAVAGQRHDRAVQRVLPLPRARLPAVGLASSPVARRRAPWSARWARQAAVRRAVRIPPAEAMRPEAPAALPPQRHRASLGAAARVAGRAHDHPQHRATAGAGAASRSSASPWRSRCCSSASPSSTSWTCSSTTSSPASCGRTRR